MNEQQNETTNLTPEISDLTPSQPEEIKGGQTREHILLAKQPQSASNGRVRGDANGDGTVTGSDYIIWR